MTVAELMALLRHRDPTDIIVVAVPWPHGETAHAVAQDDIGEARLTLPSGEALNAAIIYAGDEVGYGEEE